MTVIEAVLIYSPKGIGEKGGQIIIGRTEDPEILGLLRDCIISEAMEEVRMWQSIDPGIAIMCKADVQRLISIISSLLPEEDLRTELRGIKGGKEGGDD